MRRLRIKLKLQLDNALDRKVQVLSAVAAQTALASVDPATPVPAATAAGAMASASRRNARRAGDIPIFIMESFLLLRWLALAVCGRSQCSDAWMAASFERQIQAAIIAVPCELGIVSFTQTSLLIWKNKVSNKVF